MKYPVGTRLIAFVGNGHGCVTGYDSLRYCIEWEDMGMKWHNTQHLEEIITNCKYKVVKPLILPEDLFTL